MSLSALTRGLFALVGESPDRRSAGQRHREGIAGEAEAGHGKAHPRQSTAGKVLPLPSVLLLLWGGGAGWYKGKAGGDCRVGLEQPGELYHKRQSP